MPKRLPLQAIDPQDVLVQASADGHVLRVTQDQLHVGSAERVKLNVSIANLRRIQFDIERDRPATLVIVPDSPGDEPQVMAVPPEDYEGVAHALAVLGQLIARYED